MRAKRIDNYAIIEWVAETHIKALHLRDGIMCNKVINIYFIRRCISSRNEIRLHSNQQRNKRIWWSSQSSSRVLITVMKIYSQFLFTLATPFLHFLHEIAPQTEAPYHYGLKTTILPLCFAIVIKEVVCGMAMLAKNECDASRKKGKQMRISMEPVCQHKAKKSFEFLREEE